ncbi:MAG TPA: DUF5693 family protein [Limnochordia bacterium]
MSAPAARRSAAALALWGLVTAGALAGAWVAASRWRSEALNRQVAIVVDGASVEALAARAQRPIEEVLRELRASGADAIALGPYTLSEAVRYGVHVLSGSEAAALVSVGGSASAGAPWGPLLAGGVRADRTYVAWDAAGVPEWVARDLAAAFRTAEWRGSGFILPIPFADAAALAVGLRRDLASAAEESGLAIVWRLPNDPPAAGGDPAAVARWFAPLERARSLAVLFAGDAVLGFPDGLAQTAARLDETGLPLGLIEFADQEGLAALARLTDYQAVRVHSISPAELAALPLSAALARWERAVAERGIRLLYVYPLLDPTLPDGGAALLERNRRYLAALAERMERLGMRLGSVRPPAATATPVPLLALLAAGTAAGCLLAARYFLPPAWWSPLAACSLAAGAGVLLPLLLTSGYGTQARQGAAFAAAVGFPTLAVIGEVARRARDASRRGELLETTGAGQGKGAALAAFLRATGVSFLGALFVTGLLGDVRFMLAIDRFVGVKAMHVLPVLAVAAYAFAWRGRPRPRLLRRWFGRPITIGQVSAALVVALIGVIYLSRTGNEGFEPSALERWLRQSLEAWLGVRPRTKEFLIGHPALWLALRTDRRPWQPWLFTIGAVGQLSLVNTFAHIHSPLAVSLWRTLLGLALGVAIGWAADALWRRRSGG